MPNPANTRVSVAVIWRVSSPERASSMMVANSFDAGGTSRPLDHPSPTKISQPSARPTGNNSPNAGRTKRRLRPDGAGLMAMSVRSGAESSTVMAIAKPRLVRDCKAANGGASASLLPLWEKVARTQSASDKVSLSAETDPSPGRDAAHRVHPLPQGERGREARRRQSKAASALNPTIQEYFKWL